MIDGEIVGRGHNRRVQNGSAILHGETDCLENAGRRSAADYRRATLYTTLSPCDMCTGAALLYGIPRIVIGENETFMGAEAYLESRGVELVRANDPQCVEMMTEFIAAEPELWNEDLGEGRAGGGQPSAAATPSVGTPAMTPSIPSSNSER